MTGARGPIAFAGHLGLASMDAPLLAASGRSPAPLDQIDALADRGFAGVTDIFLKARPVAEQRAMGRRMAERGLAMGSFNGDPAHWNTPLWSRTDDAARTAIAESIAGSGAVAERMGGGFAICVAGHDPARSTAAQLAGMAENLKRVADDAAARGVVLLVEAVAPQWITGLLVQRAADAEAMVRAVDHPAVRLCFDIAHIGMTGEDVLAALDRSRDILGMVQAADLPGRTDIGLGTLDWRAIFGRLRGFGYAGLVEVEHIPAEQTAEGERRLVERLAAVQQAMGEDA